MLSLFSFFTPKRNMSTNCFPISVKSVFYVQLLMLSKMKYFESDSAEMLNWLSL